MAATIRDVARVSGLSIGTVSKFINGGKVKENNRILIENAIKELDFRPNSLAKGLKSAKSYTVGVIVPSLLSTYTAVVVSAIEKYLQELGYSSVICACQLDEEVELNKAQFLIDKMVDGIILQPHSGSGRQIDYIKSCGIPLVCFDALVAGHETDGVVVDNIEAAYIPTKRLIEMGHRKIAIVYGDDMYTCFGRLDGYKKALAEYKVRLNDNYVCRQPYTMQGGIRAIDWLFGLTDPPTAVIVTSYDMTLGAFVQINAHNLKIPEDISIIGFDNLPLAEAISPELSLVEQPMEEMGISAARLLLRRMLGDHKKFPEIIVHKTKLHIKGSVKHIVQSK